ncbi:MAG: ATP-dependent protease [Candidatus Bathyarchaeota archaeon B23]|nr:MAG: ATP-dependent protease [Candidatus Bathyarchaeota archaeon B23]
MEPMPWELPPERARWRCPPQLVGYGCTEEIPPTREIIGQARAVRALQFGLRVKRRGFNIYVAGHPGTGRKTAILSFLEELAEGMPTPPDWCYVNNFKDPSRPRALRLPPGKGVAFKRAMEAFVEEMRRELRRVFESEEYARRREEVLKAVEEERGRLRREVDETASKEGFVVQRTPVGLIIAPIVEGRPITDRELAHLPEPIRREVARRKEALEEGLREALRRFRELDRRAKRLLVKLDREVARYALTPLLSELLEEYGDVEEVRDYLKEVEEDILENLPPILGREKQEAPFPLPGMEEDPTRRYRVNLVVDNSELEGAPTILELSPTYKRLFGVVEKVAKMGALFTDYTMIRAGSAHRANGGFLILPVEPLLSDPLAWSTLKRAIMNETLEIEDIVERLGLLSTKTLRPEPIPFDAKVILIGSPFLYLLLYNLDREFRELFKVKAEFDTVMDRNPENVKKYACFVSNLCRKEGLKHLDASAVAAVVEYGCRLAGDQRKLSTRFADLADVIREASFYAEEEGTQYVSRRHVEKALEEKVYRSNLMQERVREMIERGFLLIDVEGEEVGQVNGLAVIELGDYRFGRPNRVTATVSLGRDGIIDIEREAKTGGPIHTKGVLILSGFLSERYAQQVPLSLSARLVFEQSYSEVEGDSASSAELYALLSALSGRPIKQGIAVTGSVNQKGEIQAVRGINEKVEGFYEVCKALGLNGGQGVIIPESNVDNLVLRDEVLEAMEKGLFHIYPVKTVDEGIEILTGVKAGERLPDGSYEEGSINHLIQRRLIEMAERIKEYPD